VSRFLWPTVYVASLLQAYHQEAYLNLAEMND